MKAAFVAAVVAALIVGWKLGRYVECCDEIGCPDCWDEADDA